MSLFRRIFFRKPPDGLLEISDRVYVFDYCFTTDVVEDEIYKAYIGGIVGQLRAHLPESTFMVFNFQEGESQSQIASILSEYDMTVMEYPRQYEGCPLLTMELIHHFLRSCENWLSLGPKNVLLMHCERGGWPVLAFILAGLLIYRKQYAGEQKTLDMIHRQAPHELLQLVSPLNPLPSQLRYLQYISRRNVGTEWPPVDRALTLDCIILRSIPIMDGEGGCRPILRIYGPVPFVATDGTPKVLFSTLKKSKIVRHYKQVDSELVKIDVHCHVHGDVVLECINLDDDLEREGMMFRVMFNTAFIRSNILMVNRDEIDTFWNSEDLFPKDFRAEVIFSEMDATTSLAATASPAFEEKEGLPMEAFAKVQEIFSHVDWHDPKSDLALNVLQQITGSTHLKEKLHFTSGQNAEASSSPYVLQEKYKSVIHGNDESPVSVDARRQVSSESSVDTDMSRKKVEAPPKGTAANVILENLDVAPQKGLKADKNEFGTPLTSERKPNDFNASLESSPDIDTIEKKAKFQLETASGICQKKMEMPSSNINELGNAVVSPGPQELTEKPISQPKSSIKSSTSTGLDIQKEASKNLAVDAKLVSQTIEPQQNISATDGQGKPDIASSQSSPGNLADSILQKLDEKLTLPTSSEATNSPASMGSEKKSKPSSETLTDTNFVKKNTQPEHLLPALQQPNQAKIISTRIAHSSSSLKTSNSFPGSPASVSRYHAPSTSLGITAVLHDHDAYIGEEAIQPKILSPLAPVSSVTSVPKVAKITMSSDPLPLAPPCPPSPPSPLVPSLQSASPAATAAPPSPPPPSFSHASHLESSSYSEQEKILSKSPASLSHSPTPPPPLSDFLLPSLLSKPSPPPPPPLPLSSGSLPPNNIINSSSRPSPPPPLPPPSSGSLSPNNIIKSSSKLSPPPTPSHPNNASREGPGITAPPPPPSLPKPSGLTSPSFSLAPPPPPAPTSRGSGPPSPLVPPLPPPPPKPSGLTSPSFSPAPPPPPLPTSRGFGSPSPPVPPPPVPSSKVLPNGSPSQPSVLGGKGPVPPPAPGPPLGGKGRVQSRIAPRTQGQPKKASLKPYHWLKITRVIQGSLWAETQKANEASKAPEIDLSELENLFGASVPKSEQGAAGRSTRRPSGPKSDKVQLIELRRAYNCEIMLSKVKIPLPDLMGYNGNRDNLGKCEQFFMELMKVPRVEAKLRVFSFKMQFVSQVSDLRKNLNLVNSASEGVRNSAKLRRIMQTILSLGNALNQGTARGSAVGFRLDSLLKLTETRARNNKMTLMHYLCKVLAEKLPEVLDFPRDLVSLEASTKIQLKILAEEMQAISKGLEKVIQELTASQNDGPVSGEFCRILREFLSFAEGEVRSLALLYSNVGRNADSLALYFGEDPAKCPFEQVVSTLHNFVRMFVRAHEENNKQLELEKKKAQKEVENEKLKTSS